MGRRFLEAGGAMAVILVVGTLILQRASSDAFSLADDSEAEDATVSFHWAPAGPFGGEARRLAFDPHRSNLYYLGTANGLVYRSRNGGRCWQLPEPGFVQEGLSIEVLLVDSSAPNRVYLGGWEVRGRHGGGVFVTEDRGETWRPLPGIYGHAIRALIQSPQDPRMLVAGALDGVFLTTDGGGEWQRITPQGHPELKNIESLAFDPTDQNTIYVGTWHLPWKTSDRGKTWKLIGGRRLGMIDDSDIFSILVDRQKPHKLFIGACTGVFRSVDRGGTWRKIQGIPSSSRRTHVVRQHPIDRSILYAGTTQGLWRSTDRGRRWSLMTDRRMVINDVAIHPLRPKAVMLSTNLGVLISHDGGTSFIPSNDGFNQRTVSTISLDNEKVGRIYAGVLAAGLGSGLHVSDDRGKTWRQVEKGLRGLDVFCLYQSRRSPDILFAGTNQGLYQSIDHGRQWALFSPRTIVGPEPDPTAQGGRQTARQLDKRIKVLSLGAERGRDRFLMLTPKALFRVDPSQRVWQVLYDAKQGLRLLSLLVDQSSPWEISLGTTEGLFITGDGGKSWHSTGNGYPVQALDRGDWGTLFVGTPFGLFRLSQHQQGAEWRRCGRGLPPISVAAIMVNRGDGEQVIVGDRRNGGLYRSVDGGKNWSRIDAGFVSARVSSLAFAAPGGDVYVGTIQGSTYIGKPMDGDHQMPVSKQESVESREGEH